jgi:hypothetical protein
MRCARAPPPLLWRSNASPPQILAAFAPVPTAFQKQIYSVSEVEANKASKKVSPPGGIRRGGEARGHGGEEVPVRPITSCHPAAPVTVPRWHPRIPHGRLTCTLSWRSWLQSSTATVAMEDGRGRREMSHSLEDWNDRDRRRQLLATACLHARGSKAGRCDKLGFREDRQDAVVNCLPIWKKKGRGVFLLLCLDFLQESQGIEMQ